MTKPEQEIFTKALAQLAMMNAHRERGALTDTLILDGVCLRLAVAIETLENLPAQRRMELFGDRWDHLWSTRNRIAHAYKDLDPSHITETLDQDLPNMVIRLQGALEEPSA